MIAIVLGTRPEIIKMSPVIRECRRQNLDFFILHTGQHYSHEMDRIFFEELELPEAKYNLDVGSGTHAEQTGKIMAGVERVLKKEQPDIVLVQGDTNTVMASALAAAKLHIRVGHVEAGLRSFDRAMPEELNRVVADHVSDLLFAPTETARGNLLREGLPDERIFVTGNTIVDAVRQNLDLAKRKRDSLESLDLEPEGYVLVTAHRQENVDDPARLAGIVEGVQLVSKQYGLPAIFPIHPRTKMRVESFGMETDGIRLVAPLGYLDFLSLESRARLVLTDSGGVQEEACILGVPCVTLRDNTERPETVEAGANLVAGTAPSSVGTACEEMLSRKKGWQNPFGDGRAGERILDISSRAISRWRMMDVIT